MTDTLSLLITGGSCLHQAQTSIYLFEIELKFNYLKSATFARMSLRLLPAVIKKLFTFFSMFGFLNGWEELEMVI